MIVFSYSILLFKDEGSCYNCFVLRAVFEVVVIIRVG